MELGHHSASCQQTTAAQHDDVEEQQQRNQEALLRRQLLEDRHALDQRFMHSVVFFLDCRGALLSEIVKHYASHLDSKVLSY
jgi:hypothetical protein